MAEVRTHTQCEGCGATVTFPAADLGTVRECRECHGWLYVPDVARVPTVFERQSAGYDRQTEGADRQQRVGAEQLERAARQLDRRDRLDAADEETAARAGRLMDRWEALAERLERSLGRWDGPAKAEPGTALPPPESAGGRPAGRE